MTYWRGKHVFVTGASGLLGSWLVKELLAYEAEVTCLLRDWVPASPLLAEGLLNRVNVVHGSVEDYPLVLRAINEYEIEAVFHLGAQTIVGTAARSPLSTFDANIRGTWTLLEACRAYGTMVKSIVVASSDKAYGEQPCLPYTEDMPLLGRAPYDVSKACADMLALSYFHTYGLPVVVTRCGNLFGWGDLNFNRLIPGTIRAVLQGERPVIRSDGTCVRDYFYVRDAVAAYLLLAERLCDQGLAGQAFNFGTETPMSVIDVVCLILELMRREDLAPVVLNEASHEIRRQYLDCGKARRVLGWQARYGLKEGLRETIEGYHHAL